VHEIPPKSILTPHPKEMERLFGASTSDFARIELALQKAATLDVIIVLKGHFSFIAFPDGKGLFNSTGNAGMAKAGSGDVLTGLLTGLVARGYSTYESAVLGVYLHGLAGDLAKAEIGEEALQASDIVNYLPKAFLSLS
jgi:NAD(P)H-hydrate epimerase